MASGLLLDLSGVLYEGDKAIDGAVEAVALLRAINLPVRFLTNSTRQPKRMILRKLKMMGFAIDASEVLTPAEAACDWMQKERFSPHLLIHPDLEEDFAQLPKSERLAVVVGDAGQYFTYDRLNAAFRSLADGAPFLALAANRVFKDADGELSLDAGAFVRALEFSSGTVPILLGKPSPDFFMAGVRSMECEPQDVVMIGDDAESDIAGALRAGIGTGILVRSGKYRIGDEERYEPNPSAVVQGIEEAVARLLGDQ